MNKQEMIKEDFRNLCKEIKEKFGKDSVNSFINAMLIFALVLHEKDKEGKDMIENMFLKYDMRKAMQDHKINASPEQKMNLFNVLMTGRNKEKL